jgi:hypothetical protein
MATRKRTSIESSDAGCVSAGGGDAGSRLRPKGNASMGSEEDLGGRDFPSAAKDERAMADEMRRESEAEAAEAASADWRVGLQDWGRGLGESLRAEVRLHPFRSVAVAAGAGFVLAALMRSRAMPALVRTAAGVAAAMVLREIVERGAQPLPDEDIADLEEASPQLES